MATWFSSDTHFYHRNIIQHCSRPFASVEEMNEGLIQRWNARVKPDDTIYHLGDVALCNPNKVKPILERLNGRKRLIRGNHDHGIEKFADMFEWVRDYYVLHDNKERFVLFHFPIASWDSMHHGVAHLHGHSHGTYGYSIPRSFGSRALDVGCDNWNWAPISLDEVRAELAKASINSVDHHDPQDPR